MAKKRTRSDATIILHGEKTLIIKLKKFPLRSVRILFTTDYGLQQNRKVLIL